MAVTHIVEKMPLSVIFDRGADVFYISTGWDGAVEGSGLPDGVELNFRLDRDEPCGITVIGFNAYGWPARMTELSQIVASHLGVTQQSALMELENALL